MASKKRGGLSKRELAAQKAGGTLNRKTGVITVKKQVTKKIASPKGYQGANSDDEVAQLRSGTNADGSTYGPAWEESYIQDYAKKDKENDQKKKSAPKVSNREMAAPVYNGGGGWGQTDLASTLRKNAGIGTAEASNGQRPVRMGSSSTGILGDMFQGAVNPIKGIYTNLTNRGLPDLGLSERLGLTQKTPVQEFSVGENLTPSQQEIASTIMGGYTGNPEKDYVSQDIKDNYTNNNYVGSQDSWNSFLSGESKRNKPKQVSEDRNYSTQNEPTFFQPPQPTYINDNQSHDIDPSLDRTPIFNNPGTTRRPFGNGSPMSNGAFSNGKGYDGFEGASIGMGNDDIENETNLLNKLLGINTARASEMPQQPMNAFQSLYNQNPLIQASQRVNDMDYMRQNTSPAFREPAPTNNGGGGYTGGSQGQGGGMAPQGVDGKSLAKQYGLGAFKDQYRAQEKANKQAQRELAAALQATIAQINSQYGQTQTEGQTTLDKAKQEDLLKLSGLFNFANQDPNSEQRMQYQQRTNDDYSGQMADLIAKLSKAKEQDILGAQGTYNTNSANYRQQGVSALNQISSAKQSAQSNLAQLIQQMQSDQMDRAYKSRGTAPKPTKPVKLGVDKSGKVIYGDPYTLQPVNAGYDIYPSVDPMTALLQGMQGGQGGRQIQYDENGRAYYEE